MRSVRLVREADALSRPARGLAWGEHAYWRAVSERARPVAGAPRHLSPMPRLPLRSGAALLAALFAACAAPTPAPVAATSPVPVDTAPPPVVPAAVDSLPAGFRAAFDAADARARAIAFWFQFVPTIARLRADGRFGPAASAPRAIHCERTADGVPIGGVFDVDSAFSTVRRLQVVRLDGDRGAYAAPLDTLRIAREAKLARDVTARIGAAWRRQNHPFSAVPFTLPDGPSEAWAIPRANRARMVVTGGDMGFTSGPDGALRVVADRAASWTQVPLPADGPIAITSAEPLVPAVADLVTVRYHAELGREVSVRSGAVRSRLVPGLDPATGARFVWEHAPVRR